MINHKLLFACMIFLSFFTLSCNDDDNELAQIIYFAPAENSVYSIYDTINLIADISDNNIIESISINITDENYIPVLSTYKIDVFESFYHLDDIYIIDEKDLTTADYYIHISAFDGVQTKHKYKKIRINELPKNMLGLSYCTKSNNTISYGLIDTNNINSALYSLTNDHLGMGVLARKELLVSCGQFTNDVNTIDYNFLTQDWIIPNLSSSSTTPFFTSFGIFDDNVIVGNYDGSFSRYNEEGQILGHGDCLNDYYPTAIYKDENYYIVAQKYLYNSFVEVQAFYQISYMPINNLTLNMDVVDILPFSDDKYLLLCNDVNNNPEIRIFEVNTAYFDQPYDISFTNNRIIDGVKVADGHYIIVFEDGLYWYNYYQTSIVSILSANNITAIDYDEIDNKIYYSQAKSINTLDFPSLGASNQIILTDTIIDFKLVYNK